MCPSFWHAHLPKPHITRATAPRPRRAAWRSPQRRTRANRRTPPRRHCPPPATLQTPVPPAPPQRRGRRDPPAASARSARYSRPLHVDLGAGRRPTGCARCCWAGTTPTVNSPAARSPTPAWEPWPGAERPARPPASRPYDTPRSAASRSPCAMPPARSRTTAPSCTPSSTTSLVPGLTEQRGIGPVSAAQAIVSFSHPGRCRNDAAFAALGGASPLEASSGRTMRHRLNRGGDRALNRALHTIAATRMRSCPTTRAYVARRTAEGKNPKEIRRCLKRYIARQLYRTLSTAMTPPAQISIS